MSKKRRRRNRCCCCGCGRSGSDPSSSGVDPDNYSIDPCVFNSMQQNQQFFFWLLIYSIYTNNATNCCILAKHDKLENYLTCTHEMLLKNAIET